MPTATQQPQTTNPATRRILLAVGVVVVIVCGYLAFQILSPKHPKGGDPSNNIPALKAIKTYDYVGNEHTTDPVTYTETPPAGGPHDPVWHDCGVYTQQVRNENAVHSLEHGTVWITYRPGLGPPTCSPCRPRSAGQRQEDHPLAVPRAPGAGCGHGLERPARPDRRRRPAAAGLPRLLR